MAPRLLFSLYSLDKKGNYCDEKSFYRSVAAKRQTRIYVDTLSVEGTLLRPVKVLITGRNSSFYLYCLMSVTTAEK